MAEEKAKTVAELTTILSKFLKDANDWDTLGIGLEGNVEIVKMPAKLNKNGDVVVQAKIGLRMNPNNKKNADYYFQTAQYIKHLNAISNSAEGCLKVLKVAEKLNGTVSKTATKTIGIKVI